MASSAGLGFGGASHGPTAVAHRGSVGVFRHAQPGQPRGSKGTSGGAQVFCREWEQYQNMVRKCEKTCLLVFLCIEILGKWRKFTEMIIWVDGKSWKIQVARQSHPRRGYPEQRPQDLAWRPSRIAYGMALSKDGKLGNLTKWRFLAGKLTINGDVQLPCLITGGYASQCWRNTIRQNAGDTTCFLLCACSFFHWIWVHLLLCCLYHDTPFFQASRHPISFWAIDVWSETTHIYCTRFKSFDFKQRMILDPKNIQKPWNNMLQKSALRYLFSDIKRHYFRP